MWITSIKEKGESLAFEAGDLITYLKHKTNNRYYTPSFCLYLLRTLFQAVLSTVVNITDKVLPLVVLIF